MSASGVPRGRDELLEMFGHIDIYLFDQLLRGRVTPDMRVLDAGSGGGRNVRYLMSAGAEVFAVDRDPAVVAAIRELAAECAPDLPASNFRVEHLQDMSFSDGHFDAVICSAVLHFAETEPEFEDMLTEMWRVLRVGGLFFARLASDIGIEGRTRSLGGRRHRLPDGTDRFLVDEAEILRLTAELGGELLDPIKTTNVQNLRAMTTWVLRKR